MKKILEAVSKSEELGDDDLDNVAGGSNISCARATFKGGWVKRLRAVPYCW